MVGFAIVALIVACISTTAACWFVNQSAIRTHNDAKEVAKAGIESANRYGALVLQTANALRVQVDDAVARRVKVINANLQPREPGESPAQHVEEAPVMSTTGMVDDVHEIGRELNRTMRQGVDPVRDLGVGEEAAPPFNTPEQI